MNPTQSAIAAAKHPILVDTPAQLARAAKAWRRCEVIGVDTEFIRERTYWAQPGLYQLSDATTAWLVDPVVLSNLDPLIDLLIDAGVTKILHSPAEDLELIHHSLGVVPANMVDTQLACALLGQELQLGYHKAAEWVLGVEVAKEHTRSKWTRRPLRPVEMEYAALDVVLLPAIWRDLSARLEGLGRTAWLEEDVGAMLESAARAVEPESAWQRVRGAGRLGDEALLLLRDLAAWREKTARDRDLPRGFVVRDPALLAIANTRPGGIDALRSMDVLHPSSVRKFGTAIVDICSAERSPDGVASMAAEVAKVDGRILDAMRAACALTAEELGVTPALLASRKELENLIRRLAAGDEPPARFSGWRRSVIADTLLAIYRERTT